MITQGIMDDRAIVALLCADMEGSTRLLQGLGDSEVAAAGGRVLHTQGDGPLASFPAASAAQQPAAGGPKRLAARTWHGDVDVRPRMALHIGEVRSTPADPYPPPTFIR